MAQAFYFSPYPHYVKKEDARHYLLLQRRVRALVFLATAAVMLVMWITVLPKTLGMYQEFNISLPLIAQVSQYLSIILLLISVGFAIYLLVTPPNYQSLEEKLRKYKKGEMIQTFKIMDFRKDMVIFLFIALFVGLIVLTVVIPIYNLTSTF